MDSSLQMTLLMIGVLVVFMYFAIIRPNKKQREEHQKRMDSLRPNVKVVTVGGLHGTVSRIKDTTVVLKVLDKTEIEFSKDAIRTVVDPNEVGSGTDKKQIQEFDNDDEDFLTDEEIAEKRKRKKTHKKGAQANKQEAVQDEVVHDDVLAEEDSQGEKE